MNRRIFKNYDETQLAPTLAKGEVVILDNLADHKSPVAEAATGPRALGFSSYTYSLDLNPLGIAFAELKAHLRARGPSEPSTLCGRPSAISAISSPNRMQKLLHSPRIWSHMKVRCSSAVAVAATSSALNLPQIASTSYWSIA
jgi:transposase